MDLLGGAIIEEICYQLEKRKGSEAKAGAKRQLGLCLTSLSLASLLAEKCRLPPIALEFWKGDDTMA